MTTVPWIELLGTTPIEPTEGSLSVFHFKKESCMRIVLTGAESSAKSTLTRWLARRFNQPFAMEYARIYLERHGPAYDHALLLQISRMHLAYQRRQVPENATLGFFDTDLINYKIWFEELFGECPEEIEWGICGETSHVYLLCAPDLPWEPDPLRENQNDRERLFNRHLAAIKKTGRLFEVVQGTGNERISCAEQAFRTLLLH